MCLRKDNLSRNCPSNIKCFKCRGRHHISICTSDSSNGGSPHTGANFSRTVPTQEHPQNRSGKPRRCDGSNEGGPNTGANSSRTTPTQEQIQNRPKNSRENLTALYVSASTPVLLQTAQALTYKPGHSAVKRKARLILDSGSQRTYVSTRLREHLRLPTESSERISIRTFGSTKENSQCVDVVRLCVTIDKEKT